MTLFRLGRKPKRRKSASDELPHASQKTQKSLLGHHRRRLGSLPAHLNAVTGIVTSQGPVLQQQSSLPHPLDPHPVYSYTYPSPYPHLQQQSGYSLPSHPTASTILRFASQGHLPAPPPPPPPPQQFGQTPPVLPIPQISYQTPHHIGGSTSYSNLPATGAASPQLPQLGQFYSQPDQQHDGRHRSKWKSTANLLQIAPPKIMGAEVAASAAQLQQKTSACLNQGAALCDLITSKLDAIVTSIDGDLFSGEEKDMVIHVNNSLSAPAQQTNGLRKVATRGISHRDDKTSTNYFSKVWLYSNSRLPPHLPPFKVYMPTYPLLCLAARYSERVYNRPTGSEKEAHIEADWRSGAKAMVLKSVPIDDMNTIVLAIRGSQTFMDWTVNFRPAPSSPAGFLEDPGNYCHSGFLNVARAMITPVAARLHALLDENPARANRSCSLVITGHSAGGAVAALLYAHMMTSFSHNTDLPDHSSPQIRSSLTALTPLFKRVHCITFGAPPISLLPLQIPEAARKKKSMFFAFINEGDPVPRADKAVVTSLLKLYAAPAPASALAPTTNKAAGLAAQVGLPLLKKYSGDIVNDNKRKNRGYRERSTRKQQLRPPEWHVPASTLSNAGRLVLLRKYPGKDVHDHGRENHNHGYNRGYDNNSWGKASPAGSGDGKRKSRMKRDSERIEACIVTDEQLRLVVFGEPVYHMMSVYARRIEMLATRAVTVRDYG